MKYIENLLQEMTVAQKTPLQKILGLKDTNSEEIIKKLSKILLPAKGLWQDPINYRSFMGKIAVKNNLSIIAHKNIPDLEKNLYLNLFKTEYQKLSDIEKEQMAVEMEKAGLDRNQIATLGGLSALGAAQLSGFGIYVLASSTVGAISSVLGITLPFAVYTGMSSAISFVIGPLGFLVMGVMLYRSFRHVKSWEEAEEIFRASWKEMVNLAKGDYERATLAFKYIAASRIVLEKTFNEESAELKHNIELEMNQIASIQEEITRKTDAINEIHKSVAIQKTNARNLEYEIRRKEHELQLLNNKLANLHRQISEVECERTNLRDKTTLKQNEIRSYNEKIRQIENKKNKITTL